MKKSLTKKMLMVIRKEAMKGADAASPKGLFEQKVPEALTGSKTKHKNHFSVIVSFSLIITIVFCNISDIFPVKVLAASDEKAEYSIDLSLDDESEKCKQVWEACGRIAEKSKSGIEFTDYTGLEKEAFLPEGAEGGALSISKEVIYQHYLLDDVYYIIGFLRDGNVIKTARASEGDMVYSVSSSEDRMAQFSITERLEEEDLMKQDQPETPDRQQLAVKTATPLAYTEDPDTAPYIAKTVASGTVNIESLAGTSYNQFRPFIIYETMAYHAETTRQTVNCLINDTLASIAITLATGVSVVSAAFTAAGILYNAVKVLETCKIIQHQEYSFDGGKECAIHDETYNNCYVETYQFWDQGVIQLGWSYNSSLGYNNPDWSHKTASGALAMPNYTVRGNGREAYNHSIITWGYWHHGVGNGFGI